MPDEAFIESCPYILKFAKTKIRDAGFLFSNDYKPWYHNLPQEDKDIVMKVAKPICKEFFKSKEYASGKKDYVGYYACCEAFDFCSFYKQLWFLMVCGGAALLLLCIVIGVVLFLICRKRKRGSRGVSEKKVDVMSKELF